MSSRVAKTTNKARFAPFKDLPAELILEIMRWTNPPTLKDLIYALPDISKLASSSRNTILEGVSTQQFPEYHQLFGKVGWETDSQEHNVAIEKENREWWKREDDERYQRWLRCQRQNGSDTNASDYIPPAAYQLCSSGPFGRIELFAALAEDLERAATDLDKKVIEFNAGSANVTREALMLFWKMQWNDRPGLDTLCKQDATERHYSDVRYSLFASERPQVQARFREILKVVGSRIWDDLELWDYSRGWSSMHTSLIKRARYISPGELEHWLQDFTAELTVEVISKIGIIRANQLNHADHCDWKTAWINEKMADRLWNVLGRLEEVLRLGAPAPVFQFGWKIGLRPEEICDRGRRMLTESIMETRKAM